MTSTEQTLLEALRELETAAKQGARSSDPQGKSPILPILEKIDRLSTELPADSPAQLRHFLERKSYEKARLLLEGRGAENKPGACGR